MKKFLLLCFFIQPNLRAQVFHPVQEPAAFSFVLPADNNPDVFSMISNPAGLGGIQNMTAGLYSERKFMQSGLAYHMLAAALPVARSGTAIQLGYYGDGYYNETNIGMAFGKDLGKVMLGVRIHYYGIRVAGYGSAAAFPVEGGVVWKAFERLRVGLALYNPAGGKFSGTTGEKISSRYTLSFGYAVSELFFVSVALVKNEGKTPLAGAVFDYRPGKRFFFRAGISSGGSNPFAGFGLSWKDFRTCITASFHPRLGFTPGLMILITSKKKE